jgi:hypothetical protein
MPRPGFKTVWEFIPFRIVECTTHFIVNGVDQFGWQCLQKVQNDYETWENIKEIPPSFAIMRKSNFN